MIDAAADFARRKLRRGSGTWRMPARTWYGWRACWATCRDNAWMRGQWARRESEFNRLLGELSSRTDDFFVIQIAARDGLMADPIHDWIKRCRWRGILVEPHRLEFEKLKETHRQEQDRLIFENVAICDKDGTFVPGEGRRPQCRLGTGIRVVVAAVSIRSICSRNDAVHHLRYAAAPAPGFRIDLLQIDAEGYDFEILKLVDFQSHRPAMIRYEHCRLMPRDKHACRVYLERRGYRILEMKLDSGRVLPGLFCWLAARERAQSDRLVTSQLDLAWRRP
jgi:Methyltransferase FkbM domain